MLRRKIRHLIELANLAHEMGQFDREIDLRLRAFALSEGEASRTVRGQFPQKNHRMHWCISISRLIQSITRFD